jgi:hypothetical protein
MRVFSTLVAAALLSAVFVVGSAAAPTAVAACPPAKGTPVPNGASLVINVCGPRAVIANKKYAYTVVLTNVGRLETANVKLSVFHRDPITTSSLPYRSTGRVQSGRHEAVWSVDKLSAGRSFRVALTVTLGPHKPNAQYSELDVKAAGETG